MARAHPDVRRGVSITHRNTTHLEDDHRRKAKSGQTLLQKGSLKGQVKRMHAT